LGIILLDFGEMANLWIDEEIIMEVVIFCGNFSYDVFFAHWIKFMVNAGNQGNALTFPQ